MVLLCIPSQFGIVKFGWDLSGLVWFGVVEFKFGSAIQFSLRTCLLLIPPDALHALVVAVQLGVELVKVCDGGEDDPDPAVGLAVELLHQ